MPKIELTTKIAAPIEIVFDLSRSIDLHKISTSHTNEEAIAGKTSGLIELNETVTWRAKHFGIYQELTSKVTGLERPNYFTDEMVKGAFKRFVHEHFFSEEKGCTIMNDVFDYDSPLGFLGKLVNFLFLKRYMSNLLEKRNETIKTFAESDNWEKVLPQ
ncbi:SRPBCC family protein [Costertonia aggregata]|uniref:SRPBCC family protein n=1 Tax=Costertonia aggregata TaxID=343403 RepID=A0A7H9AQD9_9FLAO|nr:SRPBCC family protein [Costertonia aggregata]QLG45643.1 SRPBCC family protein [Costertonia aggregata]